MGAPADELGRLTRLVGPGERVGEHLRVKVHIGLKLEECRPGVTLDVDEVGS